MNQSTIVTKIDNQGDRILLYGNEKDYYIIAGIKVQVKIGDKIEYEPHGFNFGWFMKVV